MGSFNSNWDYPLATFGNPICIIKFTQILAKSRRRLLVKKKEVALIPDYIKINKKLHCKAKLI